MINNILQDLIRILILTLFNAVLIDAFGILQQDTWQDLLMGAVIAFAVVFVNKVMSKLKLLKHSTRTKKHSTEIKTISEEYAMRCVAISVECSPHPIILVDHDLKVIKANDSAHSHFDGIKTGSKITTIITDSPFIEALNKIQFDPKELFVKFEDEKHEYHATVSPILFQPNIYHYFIVCEDIVKQRSIDEDKFEHITLAATNTIEHAASTINFIAEGIANRTTDNNIKASVVAIHSNSAVISNTAREIARTPHIGVAAAIIADHQPKTNIPESVIKTVLKNPKGKPSAKHRQ